MYDNSGSTLDHRKITMTLEGEGHSTLTLGFQLLPKNDPVYARLFHIPDWVQKSAQCKLAIS